MKNLTIGRIIGMEIQLKELHETNGYFVPITRIEDANAISIEFPPDIISKVPTPSITIMYEIGDGVVQKYNGSDMLSRPTKIKVPSYASRCLIIADIIFNCMEIGVSSVLITNFKANGDKLDDEYDTFDLLDGPELPEDISKEKSLKNILQAMINGQTECHSLSVAEDIEEGYELLLEVFRMGGF